MIGLPPGTILQLMYIRERLQPFKGQGVRFLEIGSGNGFLSRVLLKMGLRGTGVDLSASACVNNKNINSDFIQNGSYTVLNDDFMNVTDQKFTIIISCLVVEHIPDEQLGPFIDKCKELLDSGGRIIYIVPGSMKYWGIEDEIAGHIKRYELSDVEALAKTHGLKIEKIAGLTYPLSNWLFKLSNRQVKKKESDKLQLSQKERTVYTGNRQVLYKTTFPSVFKFFLNPLFMWPFYVLQGINLNNPNAMILYCEFIKP